MAADTGIMNCRLKYGIYLVKRVIFRELNCSNKTSQVDGSVRVPLTVSSCHMCRKDQPLNHI